jgi:pilus assembly protein TadC
MPPTQRWIFSAFVCLGLVMGVGDMLGWLLVIAIPLALVGCWVGLGRLTLHDHKGDDLVIRRRAPIVFDLLVCCLKAGLPLRTAVETVVTAMPGPVADRLDRVLRGVTVGLSDSEAWLALSDDRVLGSLARDVARAAQWGTAVSDVFTEHAAELRRDHRVGILTRARSVGVSSVIPLSVCFLPSFVLLGIAPVIAGGLLSTLFG